MNTIIEEIIDSFRMTFETLWESKLRSFLTMLGVVIGVFAVITLVAMGEGAKYYVYEQISSFGMGTNYMELHPGKDRGGIGMLTDKLTYADTEAIKRECPSVSDVDPRTIGQGELKYSKEKMNVQMIMGVSYLSPNVIKIKVEKGRYFNKAEQDARRKVCVIGPDIVDKLFKGFNPIGDRIKINGKSFVVIGVFESKGIVFGFNYNELISIPITSAQELFDTKRVFEVGITAKSEDLILKARNEIKDVLIKRHKKEDFRIDTTEESLSLVNNVLGVLTFLIGGIASISLLVGGIGIMNIMLVSVNERIREIGIRKSVGATKKDIFIQFLVESVVISMTGGTIGIILGVGTSMGVMKMIGITPVISLWSAALAYFVSIFVGIVSGVYPAMNAAALDPVEALRYE